MPPTQDDDNNMQKTRNENGADLNSAQREYEKLMQHTADVSKPLGDEARGDTGL
jgi:hypothetical protein